MITCCPTAASATSLPFYSHEVAMQTILRKDDVNYDGSMRSRVSSLRIVGRGKSAQGIQMIEIIAQM
jgi:hypothetical protein